MKDEQLLQLLEDVEAFVDRHSEEWYTSGQLLLARIRKEIRKVEGQHDP